MGYLKQIDVDNFKSWRGKQTLGPFMRFNCIIGTNGSGKSNIMDALGFRVGALRVKHASELIHGAHTGRPVARTAGVSITYCGGRGDDDEEEEVVFLRKISGDSSEYYVNGVHVTLANYKKELEKIGIVTKARNCLVFQGAVESIAMETPKERTKLFERISQSDEYAADYAKKREALQKAKDDTHFHFYKKRTATAERKQVSQEKAQKYQALVNSLDQRRLQLILFRLYHNQQDILDLTSRLGEQQQGAAAQRISVEEGEGKVKALKKKHGRLTREQLCMQKDLRGEEQKLSLGQSQYIKAKVNTSHRVKKAEAARAAMQKLHRLRAKREAAMAEVRREIVELDATWRSYERGMQEDGAPDGQDIQLEEEQVEQYRDLKELARKQAVLLSQQTDKLHWEVLADRDKIALDQSKKERVEAGIRNMQSQLEDLTHRAEKLEDYANSCNASLEQSVLQERSLSEELESGRQRSQEVEEELGRVLEELGSARLEHQESRRQQQRKELQENLRRLYPDTVYGCLVDLCSPIHRKYQLAVTKVFGRYLNAIVVSSEKVARNCIHYLKEERVEAETFLPIDYLDVSPLNERLRELRGAKMLFDVVQCNSGAILELRKVLQFVCGNTVVCETIKDARSVAFGGPQRIKTVALDGTLFTKSGVISGGSSDLRTKARCWDEKDMRKLKDHKDQLVTELRGLVKSRAKESELKGLQVQAQGIQIRLKYSNKELETLRRKSIPHCQAEISSMESEMVNLGADIQMQQENMEVKEAEMKRIKNRMDQMEDLVFADFCALIGLDNIRQYEQEHLKQQSERDRKRLEFEGHRGRLSAQLEYEQEQAEQQQRKFIQLEETIAKEELTVAQQAEEEKRLLGVVEQNQDKLLELQNLLLAKELQVRDSQAHLDQETKTTKEVNRELVKQQRALVSVETSLEQRRLAKHNLLLDCKVQGLALTLLSGELNDISQVQMDSEADSSVATTTIYEREAQMVIDYSSLGSDLKHAMTEQDMQAQLDRLGEEVSSVEQLLKTTNPPNLKALKALERMREENRFQEVVRDFNSSSITARKCGQEFEQIKAQRFHRFNKCFEHVAIAIDQIYKRLCRNTSAQAILSVENPEDPYLGGINYNCVAPGKRFMSMDNLSGGEKAIAALALLFAVHSFRPAPFFILDEVDAALDNTNIGKASVPWMSLHLCCNQMMHVTSFIREESVERMQIIVISLKEEFYSQADALLGVYPKFEECMFSSKLTLDLRPYPLNQEDLDE
ncbi:Structural maintenance of chromosomes protein 1B [Merluccius polli]|uniref:Structural maintenance of chromosomes protein n=1 Tax=Merluccius polli TaxID=89951 RepID=A0AA47P8H3_MERPO|nr:Structural maintenance of chromosomes protein 1B [Merluccius polli]